MFQKIRKQMWMLRRNVTTTPKNFTSKIEMHIEKQNMKSKCEYSLCVSSLNLKF